MARLLTLAELGVEEVSAVVAGGGSSVVGAVPCALMAAGIYQAGAAPVASVATAAVVLLAVLWHGERGGKIQNYLFCLK